MGYIDMSIEEILNFLFAAGFKANLDDNGVIKEIINNTTGEQLQRDKWFSNEFHSADEKDEVIPYGDFYNGLIDTKEIIIRQNGLEIKKKRKELTISDKESKTYIKIFYRESYFPSDLGRIRLTVSTFEKEYYVELFQDIFKIRIRSDNAPGAEDSIQLDSGIPQMYLQTIMKCLRETDDVVLNPELNSKLGLIELTAQEFITRLVNDKYEHSDRVISNIEKAKKGLANEMEELDNQMKAIGLKIEEYDAAISKFSTIGKKM